MLSPKFLAGNARTRLSQISSTLSLYLPYQYWKASCMGSTIADTKVILGDLRFRLGRGLPVSPQRTKCGLFAISSMSAADRMDNEPTKNVSSRNA